MSALTELLHKVVDHLPHAAEEDWRKLHAQVDALDAVDDQAAADDAVDDQAAADDAGDDQAAADKGKAPAK